MFYDNNSLFQTKGDNVLVNKQNLTKKSVNEKNIKKSKIKKSKR